MEWPLQGPYIDEMTIVGDHFNISGKSPETTYGELGGEGLNQTYSVIRSALTARGVGGGAIHHEPVLDK